jgi:methionyl aminopeptidase
MRSKQRTNERLSPDDERLVHEAGQAVVETHRRLSRWLHLGVSLPEIDRFVAATLEELGGVSCFRGYKVSGTPPFPSHACLSVNECVVHGTAGYFPRALEEGDVLKIDIGIRREGWIGDAAWTYVFGEKTPEVAALTDCGRESIRRGVERLQPGAKVLDWAETVQGYVEGDCGFHLVEGLGGHGYGRELHQPPYVPNTVPDSRRERVEAETLLEPGMLLAVEPMIAVGTRRVIQRRRQWPIFIADGSQCVHYEHDVLVTDDGPRVLTEGLDEIEDVITR